jgi:hypothetical protein
VSNGVASSFTVPNPAATSPTGLYYRITVKDSSNGQEVLRYTQVTFSGTVFNFDNYAPTNVGNFAPLTGNSVSGNLSVSGNVVATGTVTGTNMPAGQVVTGSGTTNTVTKFTNGPSGVIGYSSISDNGTTVSVSEPVNISGALNATSKNGIQVVGNGTNTTIQAAITAAGTTGAVEIAPGYAGTDSYNNPNGVAVIDFRPNNNALALWSVLQPSAPVNNFPLGNDLALHAGGPADIHLRNRDLQVTSSTSCTASTSCTVTVASPTLYGAAISGNPTAKFSTSAGIVIEPGTANQETVGTFSITSGTQLTFTPVLSHTQPFKIRQQGGIFLDGRLVGPTVDPTGQLKFFSIDDGNLNIWMNLPIQNGAFPLNSPQQVAVVTGGNGTNSDLVWRLNNSSSVFKLLNAANNAIPFQIDNSGNGTFIGQVRLGGSLSGGGGSTAALVIASSSQPAMSLNATGAPTDTKVFDFFNNQTDICFRAVNDANSAATCVLNFKRSGMTVMMQTPQNTVRLTSDFTLAATTSLQTITGLSWGLPTNAGNYNFHCNLNYSQATAAVSDAFGVQGANTAPTNLVASAIVYTAAGTSTSGTSGNVTTTSATNVVTFIPSVTGTVFTAMLDGQIEVSVSGSTLNIMASQSNSGDLLTIKRGSYCQLF